MTACRSSRNLIVSVSLILFAHLVFAEESEHANEHDAAHHFHRNTIAGFVGVTSEQRRERALTLGIEYERRFSEDFGILISVERALGDLDFTVLAVPFAFHHGSWIFSVGPGVEFPDDGGKNEFLVRGSIQYSFDRGGYELAPKFSLDIVDGDAVLIGGIVIGLGF